MILKLNQCIDVEKELNYLKKIFYIKNFWIWFFLKYVLIFSILAIQIRDQHKLNTN